MEVIIASEDYDALNRSAEDGDVEVMAAFSVFAFLVVPRKLFDELRGKTGVS